MKALMHTVVAMATGLLHAATELASYYEAIDQAVMNTCNKFKTFR